jgi:colanic acid/amylovoran biosynthesis glycosyltransferase
MPAKLAYIMSRFPQLTETFILREMSALARRGWRIELYPLIVQSESVIHDEAKYWVKHARAPRWIDIVNSNFLLFNKLPRKYISVFLKVFAGNIPSPKFLIRALYLYPRAVWMAGNMRSRGVCHMHVHFATHPALTAWIIHQLTGIPYSVTVHAHDIYVNKTMLAEKITDARSVVAISEFNRQYLIDYLGDWVKDKISVIHCGIDTGRYRFDAAAPTGADTGVFEIVCIGSLQPYKGLSGLLDACAILHRRGISFRCRIIGGGELYEYLGNRIKSLKLEGYVELLGPRKQQEVAAFLASADCYVQPSVITKTGKMEGIPVSIMEAMASGLPVVAANLSGIPELVRDGETGLLVEPADPVGLADALMKIHADPVLASRLARNGRKLVLAEFDLSSTSLELSDLLESFVRE